MEGLAVSMKAWILPIQLKNAGPRRMRTSGLAQAAEVAMSRLVCVHVTLPALLAAPLLMAGCRFGPGNSLNLFPEGHKLTDEAKASAAPTPRRS